MTATPTTTSRTEPKIGTNFKLVIPDDVFQKIMWWINKSEFEVSGFGNLDHDPKTNTFTVRDAILLKQDVESASTEIDPTALGKAIYETRHEVNALKWHWHSHVRMAVFWSADDRELIRSLAHQGWIVATVFNKAHEMRTAFSEVTHVLGREHEMFVDEIPTEVDRYLDAEECEKWDKEYDEKVRVSRSYGNWKHTFKDGQWVQDSFGPHSYRQVHDAIDRAEQMELAELKKKVAPISEADIGNMPLGSTEISFDTYGLGRGPKSNLLIYNPVYDETLNNEDELIDAIDQMEYDDIQWCLTNDPEFIEYHRAYLTRKASDGNERSTSPHEATGYNSNRNFK